MPHDDELKFTIYVDVDFPLLEPPREPWN